MSLLLPSYIHGKMMENMLLRQKYVGENAMKKIFSYAIVLALCFSLCACTGNAPQGKTALDWDAIQEELQISSEILTAQLTNFAFFSGDILGSSAYPLEDR